MPGPDAMRSKVQSRRVLAAVAVLAIVWIGVYWATPPAPQPVAAITFDDRAAHDEQPVRREAPVEQPVAPPALAQEESMMQQAAAPAVAAEPERKPAVIPPTFRERVVRAGDTMETIAKAEFGDSSMWTVVASANPRVDPMKMRPGMTLRIPLDPSNIQGKLNPEVVAQAAAESADEPTRIEYVVRSGDTLGGIARTYYNSAAKWRIILDANRDILTRPEQLRPGMKLVIPPAPAGD